MLSTWYRAHSRSRRAPHGRLSLERLESRALLASVPVFTPTTGLLMITGDAANDAITVTSDAAGNIRLNGATIAAGPRLSTTRTIEVRGGAGNDILNLSGLTGFTGTVTMDGGEGNDTLHGSPGRDFMQGNVGDDRMLGNGGNDVLYAYYGNDQLFGGDGDDWMHGDFDNDVVDGGAGNDILYGGDGNDAVYGGAGRDSLDGGAGNDGLFGGAGADTLTGGAGYDRFLDYTWMGRQFVPFPRPIGGMTGYYVTTRMWQDRIVDANWSLDALIGFQDGFAFTDTDGNRVTAGTWQDHEVQMIDSGLAVLHRATGNTRLLKYHNGSNVFFHRHGTVATPQGVPVGEYAWSGNNVIGTMNSVFTGGDAHAQRIVIHEMAHTWHGSDGETNPVWNIFEGLHNQSQKRPNDPSEYGNPDFAKKYGETNVFEDWATVWELYFRYIPGPATQSLTLQAKLDVVRSFLLFMRLS